MFARHVNVEVVLWLTHLGQPASVQNPLGCEPGRNAGRPKPPWYDRVRQLLGANLDAFPPGMDVPFLLTWIERESDGRHDIVSSLGEVGYFQLHPAEIEDIFGARNRDAVIAEIKADPVASIRAGGALLRHYDASIVPFGFARRGAIYQGLLKTMHTSRPRGVRWLEHVTKTLGRLPRTFDEFLLTTALLKDGKFQSPLETSLPPLPTCSAWQLLQRRNELALPGDGSIDPSIPGVIDLAHVALRQVALIQTQALGETVQLLQPPLAAIGFPGLDFGKPLAKVFVTSGWGRPRPARDGVHEGIDIRAAVGTPVFAVEDGIVLRVGREEFAGLFSVVQHASGWTSRYMHLSRADAQPGQAVSKDEQIALSGDSGIQRAEPHLHFDLLLRADLLPLYVEEFGFPVGGFGSERAEGIAVPSEPLIPADGYASVVIRDAKRNGIPLHDPPFPWGKVAIGFGIVGVGIWAITYRKTIRAKIRTWV